MHIILSVGQILDHRLRTWMESNLHLNSYVYTFIRSDSNVIVDSIIHSIPVNNNSTFPSLLLDKNYKSTCIRAPTSQQCNLPHICQCCACLHMYILVIGYSIYLCVCALLSEPLWVPLSQNNNIPHHHPNHGHTTKRKSSEVRGRRAEVVNRRTKLERREGLLEFKALKIFWFYPTILYFALVHKNGKSWNLSLTNCHILCYHTEENSLWPTQTNLTPERKKTIAYNFTNSVKVLIKFRTTYFHFSLNIDK